MKSFPRFVSPLLALTTCVAAQSLVEAISAFSELSNFTSLLIDYPGLAEALLASNASSLTGQATILVPDDSAFTKLSVRYNMSMGNLTFDQLEPYFEYHLLVGRIGSTNFSTPGGIIVPSYLTGPTFNNRSAGAALGSTGADDDIHNGQVVLFEAKNTGITSNGTGRFALRQFEDPTVNAEGGLASMINLTAVDGVWDGGYFQIVDQFLALPENCTDSISRLNLTAFGDSLDRTGLGAPLDITQNVTCLISNDNAFLNDGSPNVAANITDLQNLIKFHTLVEPIYSNFLVDGQTFITFSNQTVRISLTGSHIYFNDAMVLEKDIITNNGLMYILDRVMSPLDPEEISSISSTITTSATPTTSEQPLATASPVTVTVTSTPTQSARKSNLAAIMAPSSSISSSWLLTLLALFGGIIA